MNDDINSGFCLLFQLHILGVFLYKVIEKTISRLCRLFFARVSDFVHSSDDGRDFKRWPWTRLAACGAVMAPFWRGSEGEAGDYLSI